MTAAKIVTNPAEGHGLVDSLTNFHFEALVKGQPVGLIPAIVLLKPQAFGGSATQKGSKRHVQYSLERVEPITDSGDRDDAMWKIQSLYESRTSTGSQRPLPLGLPTEERRQALMERIEDKASELDITGADLEQRWRDHFGIGDDPEANLYGIPGDYRKAQVGHLLEFAIQLGAEKAEDEPLDNLPDLDEDEATAADEAGDEAAEDVSE